MLESRHGDSFRMDWTRHAFSKLLYAANGSGVIRERGRRTPLQAGDLAYVPPDLEHRIEDVARSPLSLFVVCIRPQDQASSVRAALDKMQLSRHDPLYGGRAHLQSTLRGMLYQQRARPPGWELQIVADISRLLAEIIRSGENGVHTDHPRDNRMVRLKRYIASLEHSFFLESSMSEVAHELGVSERHFSTLFRRLTGTTWLRYVTDMRIDYAQHILTTTQDSVTAVAFQAGFEDVSTFYRAFHSRTGMAPGRWRLGTD